MEEWIEGKGKGLRNSENLPPPSLSPHPSVHPSIILQPANSGKSNAIIHWLKTRKLLLKNWPKWRTDGRVGLGEQPLLAASMQRSNRPEPDSLLHSLTLPLLSLWKILKNPPPFNREPFCPLSRAAMWLLRLKLVPARRPVSQSPSFSPLILPRVIARLWFYLPLVNWLPRFNLWFLLLVKTNRKESYLSIPHSTWLLGDYLNVQCHACIGGTSVGEDIKKLDYGQHVVSGTPGRVFDLIKRRNLNTRNIKMLILDEADEMLSKGFKDQIYDVYR